MWKNLIIISFLFSSSAQGQDQFYLLQEPKEIPSYGINKLFVEILNKEISNLVNEKADSILLYYKVENTYNFAIVCWKKRGIGRVVSISQYDPLKDKVLKKNLKNDTLRNINIGAIYHIFSNDEIRSVDSANFVSISSPVYAQFYFGGESKIKSGYAGKIDSALSLSVYNAILKEKLIFIEKEMKRRKTPKMNF